MSDILDFNSAEFEYRLRKILQRHPVILVGITDSCKDFYVIHEVEEFQNYSQGYYWCPGTHIKVFKAEVFDDICLVSQREDDCIELHSTGELYVHPIENELPLLLHGVVDLGGVGTE